jgi:hypothetical protein
MKKTFTILHTNDMHSAFIGMGLVVLAMMVRASRACRLWSAERGGLLPARETLVGAAA